MALGETANFFCQIQGNLENSRLRIDGKVRDLAFKNLDLQITARNGTTGNDVSYINISIIITASMKYNNTQIQCYDTDIGRASASNATLIIKG